jgi:hypothetical protein
MRALLKRWWFWSAAVGLAAVVLAGIVVLSPGKDSTEAIRKVRVGMTKAEVDELFPDKRFVAASPDGTIDGYGTPARFGIAPGRLVTVEFGQGEGTERKVKHIMLLNDPPDSRTLWERIETEYYYHKVRLGL